MPRKGPVAPLVDSDEMGWTCRICKGIVYLDAIKRGKMVFRHLDKEPWHESCREQTRW